MRLQTKVRALCAAVTVAVATGSVFCQAGDEAYRWTNAEGEAVYSDRPPPAGTDYEVVSGKIGLQYDAAATAAETPQETAGAAPGQAEEGDAAQTQSNAVLCERARMTLIALEGAGVIQVRGADGEPHQLTPEEREKEKETARAQMSVYCP